MAFGQQSRQSPPETVAVELCSISIDTTIIDSIHNTHKQIQTELRNLMFMNNPNND